MITDGKHSDGRVFLWEVVLRTQLIY